VRDDVRALYVELTGDRAGADDFDLWALPRPPTGVQRSYQPPSAPAHATDAYAAGLARVRALCAG
jgi:hypothetical protein